MELLQTKTHLIVVDEGHSLWIPKDGLALQCHPASRLGSLVGDVECLGIIHGIIGKLHLPLGEQFLLVIAEKTDMGKLPSVGRVNRIDRVVSVPINALQPSSDLLLEIDIPETLPPCPKHKKSSERRSESALKGILDVSPKAASGALQFTIGALKTATSTIKSATSQAKETVQQQMKIGGSAESKASSRERLQRRVYEEVLKLLNEPDSFYYSTSGDLSKSVQARLGLEVTVLAGETPADETKSKTECPEKSDVKQDAKEPLWTQFEDRFFWNKHLLNDFVALAGTNGSANRWIMPILMGYVEIRRCKCEAFCPALIGPKGSRDGVEKKSRFPDDVVLALVSRRSRHRAGTRYRSRGVDDAGNVSNYVETEQILAFGAHVMSMVIVRGSIPIFWSQPGYKYRPPPRLDRDFNESQEAFKRHLEREVATYKHVSIINLVQQEGSESVLSKAFLEHILEYDSADLDYITFDFHQNCRGLKFQNVGILVQSVEEIIRDIGFCWADKEGIICLQKGVFRVNCVDCLDRTNVVQAALARAVLEWQLNKLGMLAPGFRLGAAVQQIHQVLWANNGDSVSRQYAGTKALKGDFTRTGERRFAGLMKDGMNSANRYYLGQFRDAYRQNAFNLIQGLVNSTSSFVSDDGKDELDAVGGSQAGHVTASGPRRLNSGCAVSSAGGVSPGDESPPSGPTLTSEEVIERVKTLLVECQAELVPDPATVLGAWGLIDADPVTGDPNEMDVDCIMILTKNSYIVVMYDETLEQIEEYFTVDLKDVASVEIGLDPRSSVSSKMAGLLPGRKDPAAQNGHGSVPPSHNRGRRHVLRISYTFGGESGFYHQFRSSDLRFFNNMALPVKSEEERLESLRAIAETMCIAVNSFTAEGDAYVNKVNLKERRSSLDSRKSRQIKEPATRKASLSLNFLASFDLKLSALPRGGDGSVADGASDDAAAAAVVGAQRQSAGGGGASGTRRTNIGVPNASSSSSTSPLKATFGKIGSRALTNVSSNLSKFNPVTAIHRSIRRAQNQVPRQPGGMDSEPNTLAAPTSSLATSASFTSRDSDKDNVAPGDDFISSCGILSVLDPNQQQQPSAPQLPGAEGTVRELLVQLDPDPRDQEDSMLIMRTTPEIKILEYDGDGNQDEEEREDVTAVSILFRRGDGSGSGSGAADWTPAASDGMKRAAHSRSSNDLLPSADRTALALNLGPSSSPSSGSSSFKPSRSDTCITRAAGASPLASPGAMLLHGLAKVGANLDPRRKKGSSASHLSLQDEQALVERKLACRTKIIEV